MSEDTVAKTQSPITDQSAAPSRAGVGASVVAPPGRSSRDRPRRPGVRPPAKKASRQSRTTRVSTRGIRRKDVILFANQLAVMVDTGVPLSQALQGIADRAIDPKFGDLIQSVTDSVAAGESFSKTLARYPRAFPGIMIALLRASEASGSMGPMLNRIAEYLNKEYDIRRQVRGAAMYPALMITLCVSITIFLLTFILPKFTAIYAARHAALPGPTRFLMSVSNGLIDHWYFWLAGAVAAAVLMFLWRRTRLGRIQIDWLKLHVPVASTVFGTLYISRGCRTLGTMNESGVPLLEAIDIVREVTRNAYYDRLWDEIDENLRHGQPLSTAMFSSPVIPDHVAQMIESGENAGRLGTVFARVADFAEAEFEQAVKTATQFIEPVMILVMGGIIGFIAIALLVPIFNVGRVVAGT